MDSEGDLAWWLEHLADNVCFAMALQSNLAFVHKVKSEGQHMKQYRIFYIRYTKSPQKTPLLILIVTCLFLSAFKVVNFDFKNSDYQGFVL